MSFPLLQASNLSCSRLSSDNRPLRFESISFQCKAAQLHLLLGPEACGTRLLLRILGLMEKPDSGEIYLHGSPTSQLDSRELAELRSHRFGFLFPQPFLLPSLSVFENVAMPLFKISGVDVDDARKRTAAALEFVGLTNWDEPIAGDLPAFDQHRVALARALVNAPECLMLEHLDESLTEADLVELVRLVRKASQQFGTAAIFSAESQGLATPMDCVLDMKQTAMSTGPGQQPKPEE